MQLQKEILVKRGRTKAIKLEETCETNGGVDCDTIAIRKGLSYCRECPKYRFKGILK